MGHIYKIENNINHKLYIGQTIFTIDKRWSEHIQASKNGNTKLYKAIQKYGINNFTISEIEQVENDQLNEREIYWIQYYNSFKNGYNMTLGGEGIHTIDHNHILELWNEGLSVNEIKAITSYSTRIVPHLLSEGVTHEEIQFRGHKNTSQKHKIKVKQYNLAGELLKTYDSIIDASNDTNIDSSRISSACKRNNYSAGNFLWQYENDNFPIEELVKLNNEKKIGGKVNVKKIGQYDLKHNFIQSFNSLAEAAQAVHGNKSNICKVCNGKQKTSYGYIWSYLD